MPRVNKTLPEVAAGDLGAYRWLSVRLPARLRIPPGEQFEFNDPEGPVVIVPKARAGCRKYDPENPADRQCPCTTTMLYILLPLADRECGRDEIHWQVAALLDSGASEEAEKTWMDYTNHHGEAGRARARRAVNALLTAYVACTGEVQDLGGTLDPFTRSAWRDAYLVDGLVFSDAWPAADWLDGVDYGMIIKIRLGEEIPMARWGFRDEPTIARVRDFLRSAVGGALFFELYHRAVARYSDGDYNECVLLCAMAIERATFDVIHLEMHRRGIPDSAGLVEDLSARLGITHTIREVLPLVVPGIVKGSLVRDLSKVLSVRNKIMHLSSVKNADLRSRIAGLALSVDQVSAGDAHSHLDATSRFLSLCAQYINSNAPSLGQSEGPKPEREPAP